MLKSVKVTILKRLFLKLFHCLFLPQATSSLAVQIQNDVYLLKGFSLLK